MQVGSVFVRIGGKNDDLKKSLKQSVDYIETFEKSSKKSFEKSRKNVKDYDSSIARVSKSMASLNSTLATQQIRLEKQRSEFRKLGNELKTNYGKSATETKRKMDDLRVAMVKSSDSIAFTTTKIKAQGRELEYYNKKNTLLSRGLTSATGGLKSFATSLASIGWKVATAGLVGLAAGFVGLTGFGLSTAMDVEMDANAIRRMIEDSEKAKQIMQELSDLALISPFGQQDVRTTAVGLLGRGVQEDELLETMKMLGDLSGGSAYKLQGLAKALTDVRSKGRLMAQEVNQFAERGIPIYEELGKISGKTRMQIMDDMEKGIGPTFEDVQFALENMTSEGGRFFNAMAEDSATMRGRLNQMKENFNLMVMDMMGVSATGEVEVGGFFDRVSKKVEELNTWVYDNKDTIAKWGQNFYYWVWQIGGKVWKFAEEQWPALKQGIKDFVDDDWPTIKSAFDGFVEVMKTLWGWAEKVVGAVGLIKDTVDDIGGAGEDIGQGIGSGISGDSGGLGSSIGSLFGGFSAFSKFATGTDYAPGGMSLVGEEGPEIVNLPRGSQVKTASETQGIMGGVTININGGDLSRVRQVVEDVLTNNVSRVKLYGNNYG